jgi:hypothetical protein
MKKRDEGKASFVEFLRSIKFAHDNDTTSDTQPECPTHFAHFKQRARASTEVSAEDLQLIRSAN